MCSAFETHWNTNCRNEPWTGPEKMSVGSLARSWKGMLCVCRPFMMGCYTWKSTMISKRQIARTTPRNTQLSPANAIGHVMSIADNIKWYRLRSMMCSIVRLSFIAAHNYSIKLEFVYLLCQLHESSVSFDCALIYANWGVCESVDLQSGDRNSKILWWSWIYWVRTEVECSRVENSWSLEAKIRDFEFCVLRAFSGKCRKCQRFVIELLMHPGSDIPTCAEQKMGPFA